MRRFTFSAILLLLTAVGAQAKSWKIGPSSVVGMDYASINAAMTAEQVNNGDTLFLDQYYNENAEQTVTKQVVIIGTGYDTSLVDENVVARLTGGINLNANNIEVKSVRIDNDVLFTKENCILDRCYISGVVKRGNSAEGLNHLYSCYITGRIKGYSSNYPSQFDIQNCLINYSSSENAIMYLKGSIINNNTIRHQVNNSYYCIADVTNSSITNNIILHTVNFVSNDLSGNVYSSGSGNTIEHNILSRSSALSYYPSNKVGFGNSWGDLFVQKGTFSNWYKLDTEHSTNAAIGYATDGGEVGCHGGMFGCPSGGRPQYIPYFTKVTVGSRTENGKLPVSVSVKIQDE